MPYNETLEANINEVWLEAFPGFQGDVEVKKMFGGLMYLYRGKMTIGIVGDELVARVPSRKNGTGCPDAPAAGRGNPLR